MSFSCGTYSSPCCYPPPPPVYDQGGCGTACTYPPPAPPIYQPQGMRWEAPDHSMHNTNITGTWGYPSIEPPGMRWEAPDHSMHNTNITGTWGSAPPAPWSDGAGMPSGMYSMPPAGFGGGDLMQQLMQMLMMMGL